MGRCATTVIPWKDLEAETGVRKGHVGNQEGFLEDKILHLIQKWGWGGGENPKYRVEEVWQKALDSMQKKRFCGISESYCPLCKVERDTWGAG